MHKCACMYFNLLTFCWTGPTGSNDSAHFLQYIVMASHNAVTSTATMSEEFHAANSRTVSSGCGTGPADPVAARPMFERPPAKIMIQQTSNWWLFTDLRWVQGSC